MVSGIVVLSLVWVALSRRFDVQAVALGVGASLLALWLQRVLVPLRGRPALHALRHPLRLLRFFATLLRRFVLSTLLTARLILLGDEEGLLMALPIRVTHPFGQFLLLNSITLTPSTISLLVEGDLLYLHWLQRRGGRGDWRTIKESLERRVEAVFPGDDDADR
jgi:multisubunit Na+/H+ antiporter MnhE subunit